MATTLPTELVQSILLLTDSETYYSARQTCTHWRDAASNPYLLKSILTHKTPISPPEIDLTCKEAWNNLFNQTANLNLFAQRNFINKITSNRDIPQGCTPTTILESSSDGRKLVALKGARASVYDLHNEDKNNHYFEFALAKSLYPLWTSVCRALTQGGGSAFGFGGFAVNQRSAKHRLAVSSNGDLVAVGLGKTIQIYDLSEEGDITSPAEYIIGQSEAIFQYPPHPGYRETDGIVESLSFEDEGDTLLRVGLGNDSNPNRRNRVRYLGHPSEKRESSIEYWRNNINKIYLDSYALSLSFRINDDEKTAFRGLRLLPPSFHNTSSQAPESRSFVSSLQTTDTNQYCIGNISPSPSTEEQPVTVSITKFLPSQRTQLGTQAWNAEFIPQQIKLMDTITSDPAMVSHNLDQARSDRWDYVNLPAATASCPILAVSDDERLLVVYETGAGHSYRFADGGALYVYHLGDGSEAESVQPWSYLLDIVDVDVDKLRVVKTTSHRGGRNQYADSYTVTAVTAKQVLEWQLN